MIGSMEQAIGNNRQDIGIERQQVEADSDSLRDITFLAVKKNKTDELVFYPSDLSI